MELEQQVCSLELAQKMKELNVPQQSIFMWKDGEVLFWGGGEPKDFVSAFTVAELGGIFPPNVALPFKRPAMGEDKVWYEKWYWSNEDGRHEAENEADARAKMLVYLLKNKLITL